MQMLCKHWIYATTENPRDRSAIRNPTFSPLYYRNQNGDTVFNG